MNLVRLCAVFGTQVIAGYAIWVYSAIPAVAPLERIITTETKCIVSNDTTGIGMVWVALAAIVAGLSVAFTDLIRRVY